MALENNLCVFKAGLSKNKNIIWLKMQGEVYDKQKRGQDKQL